MPIDVIVEKRKGWFSKERMTVIRDDLEHNFAIEKIDGRVWRREVFPQLNKIDEYDSVKFEQNELPILLEELRIYRKKLDTDELEVPIDSESLYKDEKVPYECLWNDLMEIFHEGLLKSFKITNEERETISRLIEIVEDNIGEPNTSVLFEEMN